MIITTPIILNGFVQTVANWRATEGEDFNSPYCPVNFEVCNDTI